MKTMPQPLRKLALTVHVACCVGWLGAVAAFLALAVAGVTNSDPQLVRAAYLAMDLLGWSVILPLSLASLASGIVQALGTPWGLFRQYWVVIKLGITVLATVLLLVHLQPVTHVASAAAAADLAATDLAGMRLQLIADAGAAVLALLLATIFSIYKPRGMTRYGVRRVRQEQEQRPL